MFECMFSLFHICSPPAATSFSLAAYVCAPRACAQKTRTHTHTHENIALMMWCGSDFRRHGSQCACYHGPRRTKKANWKHEVPSFNGALASIQKYCRVSTHIISTTLLCISAFIQNHLRVRDERTKFILFSYHFLNIPPFLPQKWSKWNWKYSSKNPPLLCVCVVHTLSYIYWVKVQISACVNRV